MNYYTYAHYTADTKELFYIGKGTVHKQRKFHRALEKAGRNPYWKNKVKKHGGFEVKILSMWDTEQEAFEHEKFLIQCFDKLTNLTTGGEGTSGRIQSEDEKLKRANSIRGLKRTAEALKTMSLAQQVNTKAKETLLAQIELQKKKVLCIETGVLYKSLSEAGQLTKIPFQNISKVCLGKRPSAGGYTWKYVEDMNG